MEVLQSSMEEDMIFDTHAHYDDKAFEEDREELLAGMAAQGIGRIVNIGSSMHSCRTTIELMERHPLVYGALGVHPTDTGELTEADMEWLKEQCLKHKHRQNGSGKCVAVGEIGLDYYWDEPERELQKYWFRRQLQLAREVGLPVVIHSRDAAQDTIEIMKEEHAEEIGGVIHCYAYSRELVRTFLEMGFYIGVGGVLTFKNGRKLKEVVEEMPLDRIVLETDCPYLAPVPFRGKRNSSLNLPYVVEEMAQIKGLEKEEIERITWENACRLYRMEE